MVEADLRPHSRRLFNFVVAVALSAFLVNEVWEVAQMFAYIRPTGASWISEFARCTRAAAGDVVIILGIGAIGALASGDPAWSLTGKRNVYVASSVLGLVYATLLERLALAEGRWSYADAMPLVPLLGVGLLPLLQMVLLPPLSIWLGRRWIIRP